MLPRGQAVLVGALGCALLLPCAARADGAFPDSTQILLPDDQPDALTLITNFGPIFSSDGGASWRWVCEQAIGDDLFFFYQLGPAPTHTLYALGRDELDYSDDLGCSFGSAGGALAGAVLADVFADAGDAQHVLALGYPSLPPIDGGDGGDGGGTGLSSLFESKDGGKSFVGPLYAAPDDQSSLSGVEVSRSDPRTLYLTMVELRSGDGGLASFAYVVRSTDGGQSFTAFDLTAGLAAQSPLLASPGVRLLAVDPDDPQRVYLRVMANLVDALAISTDGGQSARVALVMDTRMSAFVRRGDGTLIVAALNGEAFRSSDGGTTFAPWVGAPHVRALADRGGRLYAAADDLNDGFALGVSDDGGDHFTSLLHFYSICGPALCSSVQAACAPMWSVLVSQFGVVPPAACGPREAPPDLGMATTVTPRSGCGCRVGGEGAQPPFVALLAVALALAARSLHRFFAVRDAAKVGRAARGR